MTFTNSEGDFCLSPAQVYVASYLERLERANFDAFEGSLQVREWRLPWRVWRSYYKCTF